jgi:hypothetical protein
VIVTDRAVVPRMTSPSPPSGVPGGLAHWRGLIRLPQDVTVRALHRSATARRWPIEPLRTDVVNVVRMPSLKRMLVALRPTTARVYIRTLLLPSWRGPVAAVGFPLACIHRCRLRPRVGGTVTKAVSSPHSPERALLTHSVPRVLSASLHELSPLPLIRSACCEQRQGGQADENQRTGISIRRDGTGAAPIRSLASDTATGTFANTRATLGGGGRRGT